MISIVADAIAWRPPFAAAAGFISAAIIDADGYAIALTPISPSAAGCQMPPSAFPIHH